MDFNLDYIEKLAQLVHENDLSEILLEDEETTISLKREKVQSNQNQIMQVMPSAITSQVISSPIIKQQNKENNAAHKGKPITAPMVGTFYCSPSPGDAPFVKTGDNVSVGQIVCIIEAMKLMNEIEADSSGKITEICVKDGEGVEFGQVLMYVE